MKHPYFYSITLTLSLLAGSAWAGDNEARHSSHDRHGPNMEKHMQRLSEDLELSDEQSDQLQAVMEAAALERDAVREQMEEQFKPELCAIHLTTMEQVREILSAEQAAELESRMDRWAAGGHAGKFGGKGRSLKNCEQPG